MASSTQNLNPRKSSLWLSLSESHITNSVKQTYSYGRTDGIFAVTLGDGSTASTLPLQASPSGFQFMDGYYLSTSLNMLNEWTILFTLNYNGANDEYIVGFSTGGGINIKNSSQSGNITYYDGTTTINSGFSISRKIPYHVAISKSASNVVKIYVNGALKVTGTGTVGNTTLTRIGCNKDNTNYYNGILYDFVVFKAELNSGQIGKLKNRMSRDRVNAVPQPSIPESIEKFGGFWLDTNFNGALTQNTQPIFSDLDCEAANTAAYSSYNDPVVLSKETSFPHSGTRSLRCVHSSGSSSWGLFGQYGATGMIVGNRILGSAWCRAITPSSMNLSFTDGNVGTFKNITATSSWQQAYGDIILTYPRFNFIDSGGTYPAGSTFEVDDFSFSNLSLTAFIPRITSSSTSGFTLSQGTAASMPWKSTDLINGNYTVRQGSGDGFTSTLPKSTWRRMHDGRGMTVFIVGKQDADPGSYWLNTAYNGSTFGSGFSMISGASTITTRVYNAGVVAATAPKSASYTAGPVLVEVQFDSSTLSVWVNGGTASSVVPGALDSGDPNEVLQIYGRSSIGAAPLVGNCCDVIYIESSLSFSHQSRVAIRTYLANKWGITLT